MEIHFVRLLVKLLTPTNVCLFSGVVRNRFNKFDRF